MPLFDIVSTIFSIVGLVLVFKGYKLARQGSYEAYKMYTYGFLALAGGDVISGFRRGFGDPDPIELILALVFFYFAYREWQRYIGR